MKPGGTGFNRVIRATRFSMQGFAAALRNESAFRQEAALALLLAPAAFWLGRSLFETALLLGTLAFVLATELLNSAIEAVVDLVSPQKDELAGRAKDFGSAAVFVSLATVVLVWSLVAADRFL
jgi:diacylglycerol kinase (ATP)